MIPYPNERHIWPNFRSPLAWDFFAISTYLTGSTTFLYLPTIPDFAAVRDAATGLRKKVYRSPGAGLAGHAAAMACASKRRCTSWPW